jgi:hypothetical protein
MKKQRVTVTLPAWLIAKARLAVQEGSAPSLVWLVERGLQSVIRAVEARRGQRFRVRAVRLKAGRKGHE